MGNIPSSQLEQRIFPQKQGKLTQTLSQCVTFLGKFQHGDNLYILTEVFGEEEPLTEKPFMWAPAQRWDPQPHQFLLK